MPLRSRWGHIRARILPWLFLPAVLILVAAAVITFIAYERSLEAEVIDRERERAYLSANRLREELARFADVLTALARTEAIYHHHPLGQRAALRDARRRLAIFDAGVVLLDNFGTVVGAHPERPEISAQDWSDRPYFRQLLGGQTVSFSNAVGDGPGDGDVVVIAVPITSPQNEFLGVLTGMFRLGEPTISAFYASLVRLRIGEGAYLVDGTGQVIYHPDPDRIGRDLSADPGVKTALAGQVRAFRASNRRVRDVVVAAAPVPGTSWALVTEGDWTALISPSRGYERFLLLLLASGIALPGMWFGLLARQRRAETAERAYMEHQLQVARLIQQTLLPKETPHLPGWRLSGHYQPAYAVGGDFYDFLEFEDGRLGLIIGDVTDKGVPAALLMATTRSLLRSVAQREHSPGQVLREVNALLGREIPPKMFVTCLYAILDPATGRLQYANAGHNLPYRSHPGNGRVAELRATGMPLGLMPGMVYEEKETTIAPGECIVFYSDGLVEAHNTRREMFGNPRLRDLLGNCAGECPTLIQRLLAEVETFAGRGWQQEDDVTLMTLQRTESQDLASTGAVASMIEEAGWRTLAHFSLPSEPGNERQAIRQVANMIRDLGLPQSRLERLKTAVGEATMNAIEHGNKYQPEVQVTIHVLASEDAVMVRVSDRGSGPATKPEKPDLEAKIAGHQSPRGWGLFLIENMVDEMNVMQGKSGHTLELILLRKGQEDDTLPA